MSARYVVHEKHIYTGDSSSFDSVSFRYAHRVWNMHRREYRLLSIHKVN